MFAGHFGVAAAIKSKDTRVPFGALLVRTQLIDIIFIPLSILGIETMEPVAGGGYGGNLIHANYSHSLVGTIVIAILLGVLASRPWGRSGGIAIGFTIFSHWLLDLVVHRPDLPILPGNLGDFPLLGFGVWEFKLVAIFIEAVLIILGITLYTKSIVPKVKERKKAKSIVGTSALGLIMIALLITDVIGS